MTVKIPKRLSYDDISEVLGEKGMEKFMQRWAVHRVGFRNVPMLTVAGLDLALEVLEGKRTAKNPEYAAIASLALNYWLAVPYAKNKIVGFARLTRDKFEKERSAVSTNGQRRKRRSRG